MILKDLLKSQRLISEIKKAKTEDVFDIVVYGSIVRGKHDINDIDIAIILNKKEKLNKKLEMSEHLRRKLDFLKIDADVKTIDIFDLKDPSFVARQAVISEGFSLLNKKFLHLSFGFSTFFIFSYNMRNLTNSQKKMFYYALKGRRGQKGLLAEKNAKEIGNGVISVPLENSEEFKSFFEQHKIDYKIQKVMIYQ